MKTKLTRKNLYHAELGIPESFKMIKNKTVFINKSTHAGKECKSDRNGQIYLPSTLKFSFSDIIEIENYKNSSDIKIVVRIKYNKINDLVIVLLFRDADERQNVVNLPPSAFIKTAWLNSVHDTHRTLDLTKYDKVD